MHRQPTRIERLLALLLCVSLLNINPTLTIGAKGVATDPAFAPSTAVAQAEPTVTATPTVVPTSTPAALALAAFPAFPQSAQAASNALVPLRQTSTNLIRITDSGFDPAILTVFGPTDVTWINNSATTHTLRSGEPGTDPGGAAKLFLPLVTKGSPSAVAAAMNYLQELRQQAASLSNFSATLAPGQSFTYRFTAPGNHKFYLSTAPQIKGELLLTGTALLRTSPSSGEDGVAATRETILEFSGPLDLATVTTAAFTARSGNRDLTYRLNLSPDKRRVTLFYHDPLPGSARVRVTIDGEKLKDAQGGAVDVNGDGAAGGSTLLEFDTLSLTVVPGTVVCGRVFASELAVNASNVSVNTPLTGVTVSVAGMEAALNAKTDANGNFCLNPAPSGRFFVHIDGHTATNGVPAGAYYPFVGKLWQSTPGQQTNVGDAYLPLIVPGTLQAVSAEADTLITFPDAVLQGHPEFDGVMITVPANALFNDDGSRGGKVGIAPVPPDRLPGQLPEGLNFPVLITVQTDGAENFDTPAPVCFPNLPDKTTEKPLPTGAKSALWSFDHDKGNWVIVGSMTVSIDGKMICSDTGVGIRAPGWHGSQPSSSGSGGPPRSNGGGNGNNGSGDNGSGDNGSGDNGSGDDGSGDNGNGDDGNGDNDECKKTSVNTKEIVYDLAKKGWECTKEITNVRAGVKCLGDGLLLAIDINVTSIAIIQLLSQENPPPLSAIIEQLNSLRELHADFEEFLDCAEKQSPIGKGRAIVNCLRNILETVGELCDKITESPEKCSTFIEKTSCTGVNTINEFLSEVDILIKIAEGKLEELETLALDTALSEIEKRVKELEEGFLITANSQDIPITPEAAQYLKEAFQVLQTESAKYVDVTDYAKPLFTAANNLEIVVDQQSQKITEAVYQEGSPLRSAYYYAIQIDNLVLRGKNGPRERIEEIVPSNASYSLAAYAPSAGLYGSITGVTAAAGEITQLRPLIVDTVDGLQDTDGDKLVDWAEIVIGTSIENADTDGDSISDGAEVAQGTDPLGGFIAQTGIIGSANTSGIAVDICVQNNLAIIADAEAGVAIFNVFDSMNPKLVAQIDTPGYAQRVACAGGRVAVADGNSGLAILDISNVANARIVHQVNLSERVTAVATNGQLAYVGTAAGQLAAIDLATGNIVKSIKLSEWIQDLSLNNETLVALGQTTISTVDVTGTTLQLLTSADHSRSLSDATGSRVFNAGAVAYLTHFDGYDTWDIGTPGQLTPLGRSTQVFGTYHGVAENGSGEVVVSYSRNFDDWPVTLFDGSDPRNTDRVLTEFVTAGQPAAIALYQGRAYVADGDAGLQVINYLAYDSQKQPPTIALSTNFAAGKAEEGALMRVSANATDDVQVRLVEFYVDGKLVATDGSFPFQASFTTPRLADQLAFTLRARAVDTGGNETWTAEQTLTLTQDATPPRIASVTPGSGALGDAGGNTITVTFNEAMAAASLTNASFKLFTFGPDQLPATADDVEVTGGTVAVPNPTTATLTFGVGLPAGRYRAILTTAVTDAIGNPLTGEFGWTFHLVPVIQIGDLINDAITVAHEHDIYHFTATPGQQIYVDLQSPAARLDQVKWRLTDATRAVLFDTCLGCGEPGVQTLTHGGTYTLTIGDNIANGVGVYSFKLWNVPLPQQFTLTIGDSISNGVPGAGAGNIESPGVKDHYRFSATPGQQVYIDLLSVAPRLDQVSWQLIDETGAVLFNTCLGCGEPGLRTLTRGGVYTLRVGADRDDGVGVYSFTLWNVPLPQQFVINIGDTVSNGVPDAGAGNIESPGSKDSYQFTATAGQRVRINLNNVAAQLDQVSWTLTDATGAVLFNTCLGCGDPGVKTLTRGGVYTLTVGDDSDDGVGVYQFQILAQ